MFGELRSWVRNLLRRMQVEDSLDREVRSCVEIITANKMREGLDAAEARRRALIEIGGVELVKDQVRDTRPGAGLEPVVRDLRYAARLMRRQPLTTCAVVLTLSIGIGGVAAVFSLLNRFVFRTPVSRNPNAYFRVFGRTAAATGPPAWPNTWHGEPRPVRRVISPRGRAFRCARPWGWIQRRCQGCS